MESVASIRDLVKRVRDSPKLSEALEDVCGRLGVPKLKLMLDVETRWNRQGQKGSQI
ncbi:hypothetical protein PINS_up004666 [Pythium insidiosum]|nr:hypothetical protein PINS_up004666 [Pythium insidiosum]